jgi:Sensors of blue-light using FAD
MPQLIHLIYVSVATRDMGTTQLTDLLQKARQTNETLGLTGMLLYSDRNFFQILEGESAAVNELYEKIIRDERHEQCTLIIREPIARRSFGNWSMGFSHVSPEELGKIGGLNDFFHTGSCVTQLDAGRAKKILAAFAGGSWRAKRAKAAGV